MKTSVEQLRNGSPPLPPHVALMHMITGGWRMLALTVVTRLGVPDHLVAGPLTAEALAERSGANADALYRVLRALTADGLFTVDAERRFALTDMGKLLTSDAPHSLRGMALWLGSPLNVHTWESLEHSVRTGEPAFEHVHGVKLFEYLADPAHAEIAGIFNDAMSSNSRNESHALVQAYDFSHARCIVDVGGGHGLLLRTVLGAAPQARGVLFDLPAVVAGARAPLQVAGLSERVELVGGSFFDAVPSGGDVYLLKHVIHDWRDEKAQAILRRVREAMAADGRLLLLETVIPSHSGPYHGKMLDLQMLVVTDGGRERTEEEFRALLDAAGFELTRVVPTAGPLCAVEARPR